MSSTQLKINQKIAEINIDIEDIMEEINHNKELCIDAAHDLTNESLSESEKSDLFDIIENLEDKVEELNVILQYKQQKLQYKMKELSLCSHDNVCVSEQT